MRIRDGQSLVIGARRRARVSPVGKIGPGPVPAGVKFASGSRPDSRCVRKKRAYTMARTVRRGKSGLHRVGWRLITARREASKRATETSPDAGNCVGGETRQPAPGATPNRQALTRPAELAGRWLELWSDPGPRGMAVRTERSQQNPAYRPTSLFLPLLPPRNSNPSSSMPSYGVPYELKVLHLLPNLYRCFI